MFVLHTTVIFLTTRYVLIDLKPWLNRQNAPIIWAVFGAFTLWVLVAATVLSYLSYRYVESPFLRRKTE